jgi:hypothetical protein
MDRRELLTLVFGVRAAISRGCTAHGAASAAVGSAAFRGACSVKGVDEVDVASSLTLRVSVSVH